MTEGPCRPLPGECDVLGRAWEQIQGSLGL